MANLAFGESSAHNTEEDELNRMALEEIVKETKRGKERAQSMGPMGWVKCPLQSTNKRFFRSVVMATVANPRHNKKTKTNDDFKRGRESSSNTISILDPGECSLSQDKTQTLSSRSESPESERKTSKHGSTLTRKYKRNAYSSEDKKDKKQESYTTETPSASELTDTISDEHKQRRKHKLKHKSKHKHKKKRKS